VIVTFGFPIVTARAIAEGYLANHALISQIAERVIDSGKTDPWQRLARRFENFRGCRVMVARADHVEDYLSLTRESGAFLMCGFWLAAHDLELY